MSVPPQYPPQYPSQYPVHPPAYRPNQQPPHRPANTGGNRGLFIALAVVVVVVAVALVVVFVALPAIKGQTTTPTQSSTGTPTTQPSTGPRIPDVVTQPSGWSSPLALTNDPDVNYWTVLDSGVDDIVVAESSDGLQGIDLATSQLLWTNTDNYWFWPGVDGPGIVWTDENELSYIDVRTGALTPIGAVPGGSNELIDYVSDAIVLTTDPTSPYCARALTDLSTCKWQASILPMEQPIFGDGRWINTNDGVYDLTTGKPATFGSDANAGSDTVSPVSYGGLSDAVVRFGVADPGNVIEPWDTRNDVATAPAVTLQGNVVPDSAASSMLLTDDYSDPSRVIVRDYSWQTAQELWETWLQLVDGSPLTYVAFENYLYVWADVTADSQFPDRADATVIDAKTGKILWQGFGGSATATAGARVVYLPQSSRETGDEVLTAYDGQAGFAPLWTVPAPGDTVQYFAMAHHLFAVGVESGLLWVLQ